MCETRSGTAGAADTHTRAATGSLSTMEVRRRSSSPQKVTIQRQPEACHCRMWTMSCVPLQPHPQLTGKRTRTLRNRKDAAVANHPTKISQSFMAPVPHFRCQKFHRSTSSEFPSSTPANENAPSKHAFRLQSLQCNKASPKRGMPFAPHFSTVPRRPLTGEDDLRNARRDHHLSRVRAGRNRYARRDGHQARL